ncbi:hypothetical protein CP02DC15_1091A, partial [Chlamydia psittaci 02DC15]
MMEGMIKLLFIASSWIVI